MWTSRQSRRIKEERNVGPYLLDGLRSTLLTFKLCVNLFSHCRERLISWFPWRREWTINTLKIKENFGNYEMLLLLMTKLPWYMSCQLKFHFIFSSYIELNYCCKKSYKLCSLWSIWTSPILAHSTWSCAPEIDWQCFNYLGCRRRQNRSLRSSQEAQKVLSKPCCYQMETIRTRPKL